MRVLPGLALAAVAVFALSSAFAAPGTIKPQYPSATGGFLAGQQALVDLRTTEAAQYLLDAAKSDWENPLIVERAFIALAADGRIEDAADMATHLLELQPGNELAQLVIATVELKQRRYPAAVQELSDIGIQTFPGLSATILRAWALVGDGKLTEAEDILTAISEEEGLSDFLVFHRALMADVAGETQSALDLANAAYEADPNVPRLVEAYSRMLGNAGRFDEANAVIVGFDAQGTGHPLVDVVKGAIARKQRPGLFASDVQAGAAEMFHSVGVALSGDRSPDLAIVFLHLGMYLDPESDVVGLALAQLFDLYGQHEAANSIYDAIPVNSPMKALATVRVAENFDAMGDRPEAIRRLGNIIVSHPDDLDAISVLGDIYRNGEQFAEAADAYTRALRITGGEAPSDWRFYYVRGIAYERNKEWPRAEADFQKALELNPDQPQVLNYLGYSWVDQGMNLDAALAMIEKAVAAAPNDGYIIDSLGWAHFRLGRFEEAVVELEQAVQLLPNDPEINDHLGDAYWRTGRTLEARFQWTIAAAVDDKGNVKARVLPKLKGGLDAAPVAPDSEPIVDETQAAVQ